MTAGASAAERVRPGTRWVLLGRVSVGLQRRQLPHKVGVDALPAAFLAATRFTVAGIVLLSLAVWRVLADERPDARSLLTAALLRHACWGPSPNDLGRKLSAGRRGVGVRVHAAAFLTLFAWFVFRQPLDRRKLLGVCVGFLGTALLG